MSWLLRIVAPGGRGRSWSSAPWSQAELDGFSVRLPSEDEGLMFTAEFELTLQVGARRRHEGQRIANRARCAVLEFAREETRQYSVADAGLAETELRRKLLTEEDIITEPSIRWGSVSVTLSADAADVELVRSKEQCVPRNAIRAAEHRAQMQHLQRLTEDVYSNPTVALRWWYDQNPDRTRDLELAADQLRFVMARDDELGEETSAGALGGALVGDLLCGLDSRDQGAVLERLASLFDGFGRRDLAKRLRAECLEARDPSTVRGQEPWRPGRASDAAAPFSSRRSVLPPRR